MTEFLKKFERMVIYTLISMMVVVVTLSTVELGWIVVRDILRPPVMLLQIEDLLEIFGFFLLILIGIELLETIKAYLYEHVVHVEIVLEVALIAIARKVIILDIDKYEWGALVAMGVLIVALAVAFFAAKYRRRECTTLPKAPSNGATH
jgi:uncharacterized membrane protein (DUF373 family)